MNDILPDLLRPNLDLVICGTAVGTKSSKVGSYYAGRDNKFWSILEETGLTPYRIRPDNFNDLTEFGIGLTDLAKKVSGGDSDLNPSDFDTVELRRKIKEYQPFIVGFNGKNSAKQFLHVETVNYGLQTARVDETFLFVLPSTSRSAKNYWNSRYWHELSDFVNKKEFKEFNA